MKTHEIVPHADVETFFSGDPVLKGLAQALEREKGIVWIDELERLSVEEVFELASLSRIQKDRFLSYIRSEAIRLKPVDTGAFEH